MFSCCVAYTLFSTDVLVNFLYIFIHPAFFFFWEKVWISFLCFSFSVLSTLLNIAVTFPSLKHKMEASLLFFVLSLFFYLFILPFFFFFGASGAPEESEVRTWKSPAGKYYR